MLGDKLEIKKDYAAVHITPMMIKLHLGVSEVAAQTILEAVKDDIAEVFEEFMYGIETIIIHKCEDLSAK